MKNRSLLTALFAIIACSCALMSSANNKLTSSAQLSLLQNQTAQHDSNGKKIKAIDANPVIRLVVEVDSKDAASTFAQIREAGGTVLSKLGHQAVISIPTDKVDGLIAIDGVKRVDATNKGELKTDVSLVETGVSLIDGTTPGIEEVYTGEGITICLIDGGFDFQHPAFKDAEGNTRLRCVYLPSNDSGHKFIIEDDEAGTIEYPGSVFDTPELIATLTTDTEKRAHGTHTAGIAAGSRSPLGFGGMAPDADIVLVSIEGESKGDVNEIAFQFVAHYAQQIGTPVVLSASMNSHNGPHNGTGTMPELIDEVSNYVIPVLSVGNEGSQDVHIYKAFDEENSSMKAFLTRAIPFIDEDGSTSRVVASVVRGYSRNTLSENDALSVQIGMVNRSSGEIVWQTEPCTITPTQECYIDIESDDDEILGEYLHGGFVLIYGKIADGKLDLLTAAQGVLSQRLPFFISLSSSSPIEVDLWETTGGFDNIEMDGYTYGDSEFSCGDWTSTPNVISVGNYVANTTGRLYTGAVTDGSMIYTLNDISITSSHGVSLNGVAQPTVAAPGTNVVSSLNHYNCDKEIAETMQWQGYPYGDMSGTSMSCPTVSGIIALWLQANPTLTLDNIKEILATTSRNDEFTAVNPIKWGYGKIDAAAGIEYIKGMTSISTVSHDNPKVDSNLWFDITGRSYNSKPSTPGIYINSGRKVVIR
ncbi:MAG: S8 family serine peptidase [Muribaculaceae bacterium]|nr:S8 family serine peptidase [Muribaculaceae bacterium]